MAHIYLYSPSGAVRDKAAFRRGIKRLTKAGHEVQVDPAALASVQRLAGDDAERVAAIARAAASMADPDAIYEANITLLQSMGQAAIEQRLAAARSSPST